MPVFSRVVVMLKQREHKALGKGADTKNVFLKLFKDIPRQDIEMLLPATRIRFGLFDKLRLGGTGLGTFGFVVFKLLSMLGPLLKVGTLILTGAVFSELFNEQGLVWFLAVYTPLALLGGYAYKTYASYANNEAACPIDKHMLIALAAPRAIYIASAVGDEWADPKGEFLSGLNAEPAFALFGKKGYGVTEQPAIDAPVGDSIAYHVRTGKHDVTDYDWEQYLKFVKRHFGK